MSTAIPTTRTSNKSITVYDAIKDGDYPARIVRFIGLGVQDQPEWQGEKKSPAFKCSISFELIGMDATGVQYANEQDFNDKKNGKALEPRPSCQFKDYFLFPGAKRGGVFDLCEYIEPGIKAVPNSLDWFIDRMDEIVNVRVGHYITKTGVKRNKVVSVSAIPSMFKSQVGPSRCEKVAFNPYDSTEVGMAAYSKMYKFQRDILLEAHDVKNIPFAGKEVAAPTTEEGDNSNVNNAGGAYTKPDSQPTTTTNYVDNGFDDEIPF